MKIPLQPIDGTPSKRLYHSIIADYDLNKAISELIDNAIDIWVSGGRAKNLNISILLDQDQQRVHFSDNAGGVQESDLAHIIAPGHTGNSPTSETIGIFGVGAKRAVVALAMEVKIRTRANADTNLIEFNDEWIKQGDDWMLPAYRVDPIPRGSTQIELTKLRKIISDETESQLRYHLGTTYSLFLKNRNLRVLLNEERVKAISFESWAYPPGFEPRDYSGKIPTRDGSTVKVKARAGLASESSQSGEYGVYFYCNDRLIASNLTTYEVGFASGLAGKPHADISLTRVIVSLNGQARLMPWNSSKSGIDTSHEVFIALRGWLLRVVKDYASLSRRLSKFEGGWPENVFKYKKGTIRKVKVADFPSVNTSYLPPLPDSKPRYSRVVQKKNKSLATTKPWTVGIYESIVAVDWILKQGFEQKNRIALILLDSTLEIAFKEYLVNQSGKYYSNTKLVSIFERRHEVHKEIASVVTLTTTEWSRINYYYKMRCQLIHQRATGPVADREISEFRKTVERVLMKLFGLKF